MFFLYIHVYLLINSSNLLFNKFRLLPILLLQTVLEPPVLQPITLSVVHQALDTIFQLTVPLLLILVLLKLMSLHGLQSVVS